MGGSQGGGEPAREQGRTGTAVLRLTPKFSTSFSAGAPAPPATKVTNIEQR